MIQTSLLRRRFVFYSMKDLLIVGFGLAGLSIAKHAEDRNLSFAVVSDYSQKSSRVAGGILNPIAVKRMKPVRKVEDFLPYANKYYNVLELKLNTNIFSNTEIKVAIHNVEQENGWYESYDKPRVQPHILKDIFVNPDNNLSFKKVGTVNGFLVDLKTLFNFAKDYYSKEFQWISDSLKYPELEISEQKISYNKQDYKNLIFCQGFGIIDNPFFNNLGIYGNKGDYLIIKSKKLKLENIAKAKYFLIPIGNDFYKFGATYQREPLNHVPSKQAEMQMVEALEKMINVPYEIVDQVCGIRPTTKDRHPILGTHQKHSRLHVLNGFGSRGVMTSPLLGKELIDHIFDGKEIDPQVSIQRIYAQI